MEENIIKQFIENLEHSNLTTDDLILILSKVQGYVESELSKIKETLEKDKVYVREEQERLDQLDRLLGRTPMKTDTLNIEGQHIGGHKISPTPEYPWNYFPPPMPYTIPCSPTSPTVCQPCNLSNTNSTQ